MPDADRLARLFSRAELAPLLARMRQRVERGRALTGTVVLSGLSTAQRTAIAALLGRPPAQTGDRFVSVSLDELAGHLRAAGLCESLEQLVVLLTGPVENTPEQIAEREARWARVFDRAPLHLRTPPFAVCLQRWRETGSLKRLSHASPAAAESLLARAAAVAAALPAAGCTLARLAAETFGDAHALDDGEPASTLGLQLAAALSDLPAPVDAESRRGLWASVGVLCDELSAPALALNLPAAGHSQTAALLRAARGEPLHLSLRLLLRHPISSDPALAGCVISVCENATIVALAAERLGHRCAPLVSVQGQYATPARVLLRQLCAAGAQLRYHGDFDAGGMAIARRVFAEFRAQPWRFGAADYLAAPKGGQLHRVSGRTPWDPALAEAMAAHRRIVHEEAVFDSLATDLAPPTETPRIG